MSTTQTPSATTTETIPRDRLEEAIRTRTATSGLIGPFHMQPCYCERYGYGTCDFHVTERVTASTLAIPFFTDMTESQVDYVCERVAANITAGIGV